MTMFLTFIAAFFAFAVVVWWFWFWTTAADDWHWNGWLCLIVGMGLPVAAFLAVARRFGP
jgi:hypothetical protein